MSVLSPVIDHLDLSTKYIYLLTGCREYHPVEDIYTEVRNLRRTDESERVYDVPVTAAGAVPKGGGKFTPRYAIFHDGWRVVPEDVSHSLHITGEQITSEGTSGEACMDLTPLSPGTSIFINYDPPAAEIIRDEQALAAIEAMAYDRRVYIDVVNGTDTVEKGYGVHSKPVKTLANVKEITDRYGFSIVAIIGDLALDTTHNFQRFSFIGESPKKTTITISPVADIYKTEFENASISGTLDGNSELLYCETNDINYVDGTIKQCMLNGVITLSGDTQADFLWCVSGVAGEDTPEINCGGSGSSMTMRGLEGGILLTNKTGTEAISIDLQSGQVRIDTTTVTNGVIVIRGDGKCVDDATGEHIWSGTYGNLQIVNESNSVQAIIDYDLIDCDCENTVGAALRDISYTEKFIYIDTSAPVNGNGKSSSPFNIIADAVDFAESVGWKKLMFLADATLERTLKNFTIEGIGLPVIDFNGQNVDKSEFFKVKLTGTQVGAITAREVVLLGNLIGANGVYKESGLAGTITAADGANITLASVSSLFTTAITPNIIDLGAATTTVLLNVRKLSGAVLIKNVNTATKVATIEFSGGKIELDPTNTDGAIGIAGIPDTAITNNSNGVQVITVGVFPGAETIANAVLDEVA